MKIAICGKGGSGKSTVAALLAREYARRNRAVLVVDTDESNLGLHRLLGTDAPPDLIGYFEGKRAVTETIMAAMPDPSSVDLVGETWSLEGIPRDYVTSEDGIRLVAVGKIHEAGEGCACPRWMLARQFLSHLDLDDNDVVIADTEAGTEHFGRGVAREADVILMVVDPSYESLRFAEKVAGMTEQLDSALWYVLNKTSLVSAARLREGLGDRSRIVCEIPRDARILDAGLDGRALDHSPPAIVTLADRLDDIREGKA
jgi:CO dehydrogenase maturation factor